MTKTIPTTLGVLIIVLIAGVAGASVLFLSQEDEEEVILEEETFVEEDEIITEDDPEPEEDEEIAEEESEIEEDVSKTDEVGKYKKTASFSFDYTEREKEFLGQVIKEIEYGAYKGGKNNICILSFEGRVLCFNDNGSVVNEIDTDFSQHKGVRGVVADNKGNVYIYHQNKLYRYDSSGELKEQIDVSQNLVETIVFSKIYISNENIFYYDPRGVSYLLAETEGEELRKKDFSTNKGELGEVTGNWYKLSIKERWASGKIEIINDSKESIFEKELKVDGIVGMRFLGEDKGGSFYISIGVVGEGGIGVDANIYRFDVSDGEYQILEKDKECGSILSNDGQTLWRIFQEENAWEWKVIKCEQK